MLCFLPNFKNVILNLKNIQETGEKPSFTFQFYQASIRRTYKSFSEIEILKIVFRMDPEDQKAPKKPDSQPYLEADNTPDIIIMNSDPNVPELVIID